MPNTKIYILTCLGFLCVWMKLTQCTTRRLKLANCCSKSRENFVFAWLISLLFGYNSGGELWSTVDALMSTVDVQTSTSTLVDIEESTLLIRKVDAPMSTLLDTVRAKVDAQAPTSTRWRRPMLVYGCMCVCIYIHTHTHQHTFTHIQSTYIHIHTHTHNTHTYTHIHTHKHT